MFISNGSHCGIYRRHVFNNEFLSLVPSPEIKKQLRLTGQQWSCISIMCSLLLMILLRKHVLLSYLDKEGFIQNKWYVILKNVCEHLFKYFPNIYYNSHKKSVEILPKKIYQRPTTSVYRISKAKAIMWHDQVFLI